MKRTVSIFGLVFMISGLLVAPVTAQLQAIVDLTGDELKQLMNQPTEVVVVDVRSAQEFSGGHIRGAVNISSQSSNQFRTLAAMLPEDKQIPLVFYCRGYT